MLEEWEGCSWEVLEYKAPFIREECDKSFAEGRSDNRAEAREAALDASVEYVISKPQWAHLQPWKAKEQLKGCYNPHLSIPNDTEFYHIADGWMLVLLLLDFDDPV